MPTIILRALGSALVGAVLGGALAALAQAGGDASIA